MPPECTTIAQVPAESNGALSLVDTLEGEAATEFFYATGGADSGLPAPHVVGVFAIEGQDDVRFIILFRDGCMYASAPLARSDAERLARAFLGLPA